MDTELLTAVLRKNGYLDDAIVNSVELTPLETNGLGSEFYTAKLTYSSDQHRLPERMVIKRPLLGDRGQGEANVYELVLRGESALPIMECFAVLDEDPEKPLSFLFQDLSESHNQTEWPIIPSLANCSRAVTALAKVHAHWWGNTSSIDAGTPPIARHQDPTHLASFFSGFVDLVGEYLSSERIACYERVFAKIDALVDGRLNTGNSTLLHTDSHFWNFLYPKDPERSHCVIFDWPLWRIGLGGSDLAYMIAQHLYPGHRHRFEPVLLDRYHQELSEGGIAYEMADIHFDYRIGVIFGLLIPVMEFSWKIPPSDWMPKLEKGFAAYEDLDCQELLDSV